jgi:SAM-dependent methyltransferase
MWDGRTGARRWGTAFNRVAEEYETYRPTYPEALIDRACEVAGLVSGDRVLEVGCGTGQLTQSLLGRGLQVTAVEPGERLVTRAQDRLAGRGEVKFVNATLEEATVPTWDFPAVFSASAVHWVDPDVGWRKLADALPAGGLLGLLSYFGLDDPFSRADQRALRATLARVAPEIAKEWPLYRDLDALAAGAAARQNNVSEVWAWLGSYDLGRRYVAELFEPALVSILPIAVEHTADELSSLLATMSFWARLSSPQREALAKGIRGLEQRLGRPIRANTAACLVTARRLG